MLAIPNNLPAKEFLAALSQRYRLAAGLAEVSGDDALAASYRAARQEIDDLGESLPPLPPGATRHIPRLADLGKTKEKP